MKKLRGISVCGLALFLTLSMAVAVAPRASAYGAANFQVGFAGTGVLPGVGQQFGFWGWCVFAGGSGSPATSGNEADCQFATYFQTPTGVRFQEKVAIQGTAWDLEGCTGGTMCLTPFDFFITAGTETISGPVGAQIIAIAGPPLLAVGCTITGSTVTCPLSIWEIVPPGCPSPSTGPCVYSPDTGIPSIPGHYGLNALVRLFGLVGQFQIQLVQLS